MRVGLLCVYSGSLMRLVLVGYRELHGDFTGNTIVTGFKRIWKAKRRILTGETGKRDLV